MKYDFDEACQNFLADFISEREREPKFSEWEAFEEKWKREMKRRAEESAAEDYYDRCLEYDIYRNQLQL